MDKYTPQQSTLQRNKTERGRLQGLQRSTSNAAKKPTGPRNFAERVSLWLINEGQRHTFFAVFLFLHLLVAVLGFMHYGLKDNLNTARKTFGITFTIARAAALVLHVDVIFILLPVCRNFVSVMRRTPLGTVIPFDKNITLHKATAWAIFTGSLIHTLAHIVNLYRLTMADNSATTTGQRVVFFITANFIIGPLITGWLMWGCLGVMPDRPPFCSFNTIGVFWRYWLVGGIIWIYERILREVRSRHVTYISKVVQIKKEKTTTRAGQYIFINCPEISYFQWHPFTLTSAPEEDYISVHIRVEGDFTTAFAKALGCDFGGKGEKDKKGDVAGGKVIGTNTNPPVNRTLPRVMVDGPFGTSSEEFLDYETVLLVGAGIGVTPFASILKNIWYRMNNFNHSKPTRLSKVYFTWVIRDFGTAEWFHSLLHAIEEQDTQNRIEINIYLTAKIKEDDMNNIIMSVPRNAITSLRAPTHFGRPNWDKIFSSIVEKHPESDVGVFFCGPAAIAKTLHIMSNKHSDVQGGTRFFFGKGEWLLHSFICLRRP
ncbi:NADPH oxidase [Mycena haematopus]|nr:NADPH oxidase [Mycena haematopus]